SIPKSGRMIYSVIKSNGTISYSQLLEKTDIPKRTLSYALQKLKEKGLIVETPNFLDMRNKKYIAQ
ncbi:MAG: helix-turn-helix transcriptional regulator, partial [Candidatus Aenigmarchaeota archaeon]|nr:helix-turn-helix transcriptional regulator [Candidatus Aenigmarchaeota archaeon]